MTKVETQINNERYQINASDLKSGEWGLSVENELTAKEFTGKFFVSIGGKLFCPEKNISFEIINCPYLKFNRISKITITGEL